MCSLNSLPCCCFSRILAVESADEFYSLMAQVQQEMFEYDLIDCEQLIEVISTAFHPTQSNAIDPGADLGGGGTPPPQGFDPLPTQRVPL